MPLIADVRLLLAIVKIANRENHLEYDGLDESVMRFVYGLNLMIETDPIKRAWTSWR